MHDTDIPTAEQLAHLRTATIDAERIDRLRTFLTTEAGADLAGSLPTPFLARHRRLAAGAAAAVVLGGGIVAVNAVTGGPGGPNAAQAVAISQEDGWTTVRLVDIDADPSAVVHELEAAHIPVTTKTIHARSGDDGTMTVDSDDVGNEGTIGMMAMGAAGDHGIVGLSVASTGPAAKHPISVDPVTKDGPRTTTGSRSDGPATTAEGNPPSVPEMEALGIRLGPGGDVSIKNGSANEVVVYTSK